MNLTKEQYVQKSYLAFYWVLYHIFEQRKHPVTPHPFSLCDLLSNMCPYTFADSPSADPAVYAEYEEILMKKLSMEDAQTILQGYQSGREFIQMYIDEYAYDLAQILQEFSLEDYSFAFEHLEM